MTMVNSGLKGLITNQFSFFLHLTLHLNSLSSLVAFMHPMAYFGQNDLNNIIIQHDKVVLILNLRHYIWIFYKIVDYWRMSITVIDHCVHNRKMKWNELGFRPPLCTYRLNWARRMNEMNEMTLSSRHRIRNSSPGGLRPSTLPLGPGVSPQYCVLHVDGEKHFCFFQTAETGNRTPNSSVKGSGVNHYPRAPVRT